MKNVHVAAALAACLALTFAAPACAQRSKDLLEARQRLKAARQVKTVPGRVEYTQTSANEPFQVALEARIMGKKRANIGTGHLRCETTGTDTFGVALSAKASYKKDEINFNVHRDFRLEGNIVTPVNLEENMKKDEFSDYARKYEKKILDTVSLAYLIKFRSPTNPNGPWKPVEYRIGDRIYTLSYIKAGNELEVTLKDNQGPKPVGKFFCDPPTNGQYPFRMFRIYTRDKVVAEFEIHDRR